MPLKIVAVAGAVCCFSYYVLCLRGAWRFVRRATVRPGSFLPTISVLKPLSGTDPKIYESLKSHCTQDYPAFEILFGVSDPGDPVLSVVEQLLREFPDRALRLVVCPKVLGANRKVSNLIQMLPEAANKFLLINDGDIRVPRDYLRQVIGEFVNPRVGLVTCLYRGVAGRTLGSRLEALAIGAAFAGGVLSAREAEGGIHFGLGSTLALRRDALAAIGGLEPLADYLADDFELGRRIAARGFDVALSHVVVDHCLPDYSLSGFVRHQLRWARSTRDSRPWGYLGLALTLALPWALLAAAASGGAAWGWGLLAAVACVRMAAAVSLTRSVLDDPRTLRDLWLIPLSDLFALIIWLGGYTGRRVSWRGDEFILEGGKLRPAS